MLRRILRVFKRRPGNVEDILRFPEGKRIYREFHELRREQMDQDALKVINRLNRHGYRSYLVGGCVRDMLLGKKPKDFDVVTSATPAQVRKVFTNSRSIGRRFKIVHVVFQGGKVIEVSTFRSLPSHRLGPQEDDADYMLKRDNEYGAPREDAARRDFSINALFFDPRNESLIDYVGGYDDIRSGRISVIGDGDISFQEDPVRMLRAAKFAALLEFDIEAGCLKAIKRQAKEIAKASPARLLEEYNKIFRTGKSAQIFGSLASTGLFKALFPEAWQASEMSKGKSFEESGVGRRLAVADRMLSEREELTTTIFMGLIIADAVGDVFEEGADLEHLQEYVKDGIGPICRRLQLPGKDQDRLLQMFLSQGRFRQTAKKRRGKPEHFRNKIFFFEAFMLFKIHAIAREDDESIQKAMFWEIGPRMRPPEPGKIVSVFPVHRKPRRSRDGGRDSGAGAGSNSGGGQGRRNRSRGTDRERSRKSGS